MRKKTAFQELSLDDQSKKIQDAIQFGSAQDFQKLIDQGTDLSCTLTCGLTPWFILILFANQIPDLEIKVSKMLELGIAQEMEIQGTKSHVVEVLEQTIQMNMATLEKLNTLSHLISSHNTKKNLVEEAKSLN